MTLPTNNTEWGYSTIRHHADQTAAWDLAMTAIQTSTGCPDTAVRDFLDSTFGRHFADDVANGLVSGREGAQFDEQAACAAELTLAAATEAAVARWMGWTISRRTSRDTGIPHGLPYLTGFVTHCEIMADAA